MQLATTGHPLVKPYTSAMSSYADKSSVRTPNGTKRSTRTRRRNASSRVPDESTDRIRSRRSPRTSHHQVRRYPEREIVFSSDAGSPVSHYHYAPVNTSRTSELGVTMGALAACERLLNMENMVTFNITFCQCAWGKVG